MEINIPEGLIQEERVIVTQEQTATAYGSGLAEVYATPAMIALMEKAAYKGIDPYLPKNTSTVGMEINVKHLKATLPGKEVKAVSKVEKVEGRKVYFSVEAFESDGEHLIGTAEHIRFVIDNDRFFAKLSENKK